MIKYPLSLSIVLLIGYAQVFAHLDRTYFQFPHAKQIRGRVHFQAPVKRTEKEDIIIEEEENRRNSSKESKDDLYASFFYADLSEHFFQRLKSHSFFNRCFSRFSLFGSSAGGFCILRL
jgi:hypothetical protein